MALFKILKGQSADLPNTYHEGYCYFTTDTKKFYIDISSENNPSSRVELNANIADYAARAYYDEDGINIKNNYLKTGTNSSLNANETLITDNQKNVTTRKLVEGYSIVAALPATPDQNIVYLIEDGTDPGVGGSGSGGGNVTISNTLNSGSLIATINSSNIYIPDDLAKVHYGECSTAGSTVQKEVTITNVTELTTGLTINVKFTNANTVANPTLKVNALDAKAIKRYGTTAPSTSAASSWNSGAVVTLTYDGTYWQLHDWENTTYSAMSQSEMQTGTATSSRLITATRLKEAIEYYAPSKVSDLTNDLEFLTLADLPIYDGTVV